MHRLGRIPREGERFDWQGYRFEVMDMDGRRVDKVLVETIPGDDAEENPPPAPEQA